MLRKSFAFVVFTVVLSLVNSSAIHAETIAYLSAGPGVPGNLDLGLTGAAVGTDGTFDIFVRTDLLVAGVSLNLLATGTSIDLTGGTVPAYSPRWANATNGTAAGDGSAVTGMDAFAIPGFGSNGLNPAAEAGDTGYNAGADAFHFATINYHVVSLGETTFKLQIGDNEFGVDGPIFLGTGDAAAADTGAGSALLTSTNIDGRILVQGDGGGTDPVVGDLNLSTTSLNQTIAGLVPVTDVVTLAFDDVNNPGWMPLIPGKTLSFSNLPTLDNAGNFSWDTTGARRGHYAWAITGTNPDGTDGGTIGVDVNFVPEPATLSLLGLALVGLVGVARRRG